MEETGLIYLIHIEMIFQIWKHIKPNLAISLHFTAKGGRQLYNPKENLLTL